MWYFGSKLAIMDLSSWLIKVFADLGSSRFCENRLERSNPNFEDLLCVASFCS